MCSFSRTGVKKYSSVQVRISLHSQQAHHTIELLFEFLLFSLLHSNNLLSFSPVGTTLCGVRLLACLSSSRAKQGVGPLFFAFSQLHYVASVFSPASHLLLQNKPLAYPFSPSLNCIDHKRLSLRGLNINELCEQYNCCSLGIFMLFSQTYGKCYCYDIY